MSDLFAPTVTTDGLLAATGDRAWLAALLDAEAALAAALVDTGRAPPAAGGAVRRGMRAGRLRHRRPSATPPGAAATR